MLTIKRQIYQFLSFSLTPELQALLPTQQISEILSIEPSQIVPLFDLPSAIMGVYNKRNEVLWIVDLAYLLDFEPLLAQDYCHLCHLIVIVQENLVVGLAVRQVDRLVLCHESQIQVPSPMSKSSKLAFCLYGEKPTVDGKKLLVLDAEKILNFLNNLDPENPY